MQTPQKHLKLQGKPSSANILLYYWRPIWNWHLAYRASDLTLTLFSIISSLGWLSRGRSLRGLVKSHERDIIEAEQKLEEAQTRLSDALQEQETNHQQLS